MHKRIPQLDGIRGIAVLMVILHNTSGNFPSLHLTPIARYGWMGVDLFFVLSGFLITSILLDSQESKDYFRNFYARRCLRIWPLYFSLICFMFALVPLLRPADAHMVFARSAPWWSYLFFAQNFLVAIPTNAVGALAVTWSLAIEEQFYLVWPPIVRFCSRRSLLVIGICIVGLSPLLRWYLQPRGVIIYSNLFCRLDGLMLGALLAVVVRSPNFRDARFLRAAWISLLTAAPLAVVLENFNARWLVFSLSAWASASFVYLALFARQKWLQKILQNRFLVYTGVISYGLYLLHKIPFDFLEAVHINANPLASMIGALASAYAIAVLSWHTFEKRVLSFKRFFQLRQRTDSSEEMTFAAHASSMSS